MFVVVKGPIDLAESALYALEESLLGLLEDHDKGRALFYMALVNDHRFVTKSSGLQIVYQYCHHHSTKKKMRYIFSKALPRDFDNLLGIIIGAKGKNKKRMMKETKCSIEINSKSDHPHYVIYGDSVDAVDLCAQKMESSLKEARKVT